MAQSGWPAIAGAAGASDTEGGDARYVWRSVSRNRTTTRALSAGLSLTVAIGFPACGGSGSDAPKTAAQYRREVNAVCRTARTAVAELPKAESADPVALVKLGQRALVDQREGARSLQALRPPAQLSRATRAWLALVGRTLDAVDASLRAQARSDLAAAEHANATASKLAIAADAAARELGASDCASPPA